MSDKPVLSDKLIVNGIIKFSNVDGPGNRLTIFTQGCNIACVYCHNFETINLCNSCGICVKTCPTNALQLENKKVVYYEDKCVNCDECIKVCENSSSPKTQEYTVDELCDIISKYKVFLRGITVSGGECTMQAKVITKLFEKIKAETNLTCFVDTNGYFDLNNEDIKALVEITDKFMVDIKAINNAEEIIKVKETNRNIENLEALLNKNKVHEVRTVVTNNFDYFKPVIDEVSSLVENFDVEYHIIKMRAKVMKENQRHLESLAPSDEDMEVFTQQYKDKPYIVVR